LLVCLLFLATQN